MSPHIRVLRVVASELDIQKALARDMSRDPTNENATRMMFLQNASLIGALRDAISVAADRLDEEEARREQRVAPASSSER